MSYNGKINLIECIKITRSVSGCGLKEAKDIIDELNLRGAFIFSDINKHLLIGGDHLKVDPNINADMPKKATNIRKLLDGPSFGFSPHDIKILEAIKNDIEGS